MFERSDRSKAALSDRCSGVFELDMRRVSTAHSRTPPPLRAGRRRAVAQQTMIIWFPNGDAEFCVRSEVPSIGEKMTMQDSDWIVARVETHVDETVRVTVTPSAVVRDDSWPAPYEFLTR
jgi:hypothetical protein